MLRQVLVAPSRAVRPASRLFGARVSSTSHFQPSSSAIIRRLPAASSRWYSDTPAKDAATEATKEAEQANAASSVSPAEAELKKKLEEKEKEALDYKDKFLRSVADFRNLQDRTQREMKSARDFAIQRFAKDLVDSVDNLDRALATVPAEKLAATEKTEHLQDLVNLYEGLKMTENILMETLKKHGLERFDPDGQKFNPNEHDATFMAPQSDKEHNTVFHVQQKGFKLNGRVLRAAKVGVVKNQ